MPGVLDLATPPFCPRMLLLYKDGPRATLKPLSCHEITEDKDANHSRNVQDGSGREGIANEPLNGGLEKMV